MNYVQPILVRLFLGFALVLFYANVVLCCLFIGNGNFRIFIPLLTLTTALMFYAAIECVLGLSKKRERNRGLLLLGIVAVLLCVIILSLSFIAWSPTNDAPIDSKMILGAHRDYIMIPATIFLASYALAAVALLLSHPKQAVKSSTKPPSTENTQNPSPNKNPKV